MICRQKCFSDGLEQTDTDSYGRSGMPRYRHSVFTLIELLVSTTCQIGVLPLYLFKKTIPEFRNIAKGDFSLRPGSPARKRGSDGRDIGADLTVFAAE